MDAATKDNNSLGYISKELAKLWNATSLQDREPFLNLAEKAKTSYLEQKEEWSLECQQLLGQSKNKSTTRKKKMPKGTKIPKHTSTTPPPKRPRSAYIFFCAARRAEIVASNDEKKTLGQISKELSQLWSETLDRKPFEDLAAKDKLRYQREKEGNNEVENEKDSVVSNKKKTDKKKTTQKKKRGLSGYMLFCAKHRSSIVDENGNKLSLGETTKRLATLWKNCEDTTRNQFLAEAAASKT